ncbi:hypothetical protein QQ045_013035 [Rhodiola kirilowii]
MALESRTQPHINNSTSFYAFGSSPSARLEADLRYEGELSSPHAGLYKKHSLKLHQQGHMMQGGSGKVISNSNDGSLISFEDSSNEAAAGGHGHSYEHNSNARSSHTECFNNSHQTASSFDSYLLAGVDHRSHLKLGKENNRDDMLDWSFYSSDPADDHTPVAHKQPPTIDECYIPPNKKQCTNSTSTTKKLKHAKPAVASKDPQSIAAKNRRERISERLKILQELVPNGTKVDLVTMLEKAIGYVKFLQLQVKVLAADEFWPVQGGKAPELSQVKDAIDAILLSQRSDRNSASD